MKTLAGAAIGGARKTFKHTDMNAPLRANATLEAVGGTAVYLASDAGLHDGRDHPRRRRLSRPGHAAAREPGMNRDQKQIEREKLAKDAAIEKTWIRI
jgi:hypothetical protein